MVDVIEFFDRLLPRQLDEESSSLLRSKIEEMGIRVHLGMATEEILGQEEITGLKFKGGGGKLDTNMAVVAAGIRANVALAEETGLETDKGIVVNDILQSSQPAIFAAGDAIQHRDRLYGIIPATFEQARLVASNLLGEKKDYKGTIPWNSLKVAGIYLTSMGLINPVDASQEEIREVNKEEGIYKKLILDKGIIVGALWLGTKQGIDAISRAVDRRINVDKWKDSILSDDFDYSFL
jgi:nitrite reductase (NADH) large subunit